MTTTNSRGPAKETKRAWGNLQVPRDELQAQINIYEETVTVVVKSGDRTTVKIVEPDEIAHALAGRMTFTSPVLTPDALWWRAGREGTTTCLWREPAVRRVALQLEAMAPPVRLVIPMPGLVFACTAGRPPSVWAAKERPTSGAAMLYHSPTFNTFGDGRVCAGTHRFPNDPALMPESFFASLFSHTGHTGGRSLKHPGNLRALWEELDGAGEYPLDDLVEFGTMDRVMKE